MVRQKLLDRMLDQSLNRCAPQDGGQLEVPVFGLGIRVLSCVLASTLRAGKLASTTARRRLMPGFDWDF